MKKFKLLFVFLLVTTFSCGFYIEMPVEKFKDLKTSSKDPSITSLTFDDSNNIFFINNNQIKKLDSKNQLTTIAGKEKEDNYPEDEVIDGDLNTSKFGNIQNVTYISSKKEIYFSDFFRIEKLIPEQNNLGENSQTSKFYKNERKITILKSFVRKITQNNKVSTLLQLNDSEGCLINNKGLLYTINLADKIIKKINHDGSTIEENFFWQDVYDERTKEFRNENSVLDMLLDSEGNIYFVSSKKLLRIGINREIETIYEANTINLQIFLDENHNLYIKEDPRRYNMIRKQISGFNEPILLHKIPKSDLKNKTLNKDIKNKKYFIGNFPKDYYSILAISDKTKTLFAQKANSIFKLKLEK